jgi:restriction system protein
MIPDFQTIMLPFLETISDKKEYDIHEIIDRISKYFNLTNEEKEERLESSNQPIINNRVNWTKTYLKKSGLVTQPRRAVVQITDLGIEVLAKTPEKINIKYLKKLPKFQEWQNTFSKSNKIAELETNETEISNEIKTPEELLEYAYLKLKHETEIEILDKVKSSSPLFFERLVIDLLIKMGYGGSRKDAGQAIGKSGDGGIDGIIKEDKLGLDIIYIQAKKWENTVPIKEVRDFAGALMGKRAKKGIFITTADFNKNAFEYVNSIEHKIILIDGKRLAELMFEHNLAITTINVFEQKRIDNDYFDEI